MKYQSNKHKQAMMLFAYGSSLETVMKNTGYKKRLAKKRFKQFNLLCSFGASYLIQ